MLRLSPWRLVNEPIRCGGEKELLAMKYADRLNTSKACRDHQPRSRRTAVGSVERAAMELGRVARSREAWCDRRHAKALQDESDERRPGDLAKHAEPTSAAGAPKHVDLEASPEQRGPVHTRGRGVQRAACPSAWC